MRAARPRIQKGILQESTLHIGFLTTETPPRKYYELLNDSRYLADGVLRILVVYDTRTGNTEKMTRAISEGAASVAGVEV